MEQKIRAMAEKHRKLEDELRSKIAEKRAAGQTKDADDLEKQLAKLSKQGPQMQQLERMAKQLGQCAQCTKQGDGQAAAAALRKCKMSWPIWPNSLTKPICSMRRLTS